MFNMSEIFILSAIQGACELLPVSSSAHVIVAEKLMGLDPASPQMTMLLVMLHTGTMLAVIVFFGKAWKANFFSSQKVFLESVKFIAVATIATGFVGLLLKILIEKIVLKNISHPEIELLFGNLPLISTALATVGILILWAGYKEVQSSKKKIVLGLKAAFLIGMVQGICLPFRGFSRSGATISTGLILGVDKKRLEDFSFALAVVLTPPVILKEGMRFLKAQHASAHDHQVSVIGLFLPSMIGMVLSFIFGILALRWLSNWLEGGRWYLFGIYCLFVSAVIFILHTQGL
ncbi:MAG: undecaprenyl-diphosphate phosphatase [Candidatus Omnitrophica bacterium]|nr:undecaprenyl-diphosphate phosphatase [Candidatus Omnitrophota bacterium]